MFRRLSSREHMILLMIHEQVSFDKDKYIKELDSLVEKTYIHKLSDGSYIKNKRGTAFIHQQRDPSVDINRLVALKSVSLKRDIIEALVKSIEIGRIYDTMVSKNIENSQSTIIESVKEINKRL